MYYRDVRIHVFRICGSAVGMKAGIAVHWTLVHRNFLGFPTTRAPIAYVTEHTKCSFVSGAATQTQFSYSGKAVRR